MSSKRPVNVEVHIRETKGDINKLIRKFMKKVKKERILEDFLLPIDREDLEKITRFYRFIFHSLLLGLGHMLKFYQ